MGTNGLYTFKEEVRVYQSDSDQPIDISHTVLHRAVIACDEQARPYFIVSVLATSVQPTGLYPSICACNEQALV